MTRVVRIAPAIAIAFAAACSARPVHYPVLVLRGNCEGIGHIRWSASVDETLCLDDDLRAEVIRRALRRGAPVR